MATDGDRTHSLRVVVIASTRRDGEVTQRLLDGWAIECVVAPRAATAAQLVDQGVGALLLTDLALMDDEAGALLHALERQPDWSNLPIVALCRDAGQPLAVARALQQMRNVTVLDRPASTRTVISALRAALRGRLWQYQIRDQIIELMDAHEALRQADQRKDGFLATLAHELRNPLAPIKTGLELLRRPGLTADEAAHLREMMERQLTQLIKLTDELLDLSRISTGKIVLQRQRVDLRAVINGAVECCQPVIDAAHHRLTVALPGSPVWVFGDAGRLEQAIGNLINNAAKYTADGGLIEVAAAERDGEAVVTVTDNGTGIPAVMLERIFDIFTQVDRTLDRAQGGLGIGLSLVRSLVGLHDGSVTAQSAGAQRGSTFQVRLPAIGASPLAAGGAPAPGEPAAPPRALRVLVIDDNVDAADSLAMLLKAVGHRPRVEYEAAAALLAAADFRPEAIFCDIVMPGLSGFDLASRLRQDQRFAATRLIAVTGWGAEEDKRRTRSAGFDFHLTKPASAASVEEILSQL
jgi:signal transduction histidine kinase/CheY-like chemotaxis protein